MASVLEEAPRVRTVIMMMAATGGGGVCGMALVCGRLGARQAAICRATWIFFVWGRQQGQIVGVSRGDWIGYSILPVRVVLV